MWLDDTALTNIPDPQLSSLIDHLDGIREELETNLGRISDLTSEDPEEERIVDAIETALQYIISNITSL